MVEKYSKSLSFDDVLQLYKQASDRSLHIA